MSRPELLRRLFSGLLPGLLLLLAVQSLIPRQTAAGVLGPALVALAADVALCLLVFVRLDRVPGRELIRGGAVSGHAGAAVFLMNLNEVGRALSADPDGVASARPARW